MIVARFRGGTANGTRQRAGVSWARFVPLPRASGSQLECDVVRSRQRPRTGDEKRRAHGSERPESREIQGSGWEAALLSRLGRSWSGAGEHDQLRLASEPNARRQAGRLAAAVSDAG